MKLKITEIEAKEIETELELPVYFYFQDDFDFPELVMIAENYQITIKFEFHGIVTIEKSSFIRKIDSYHLKNNLTTKNRFLREYREALKIIKSYVH